MNDLKDRPDRYVQFSVFGKKYKEPKKVEVEVESSETSVNVEIEP